MRQPVMGQPGASGRGAPPQAKDWPRGVGSKVLGAGGVRCGLPHESAPPVSSLPALTRRTARLDGVRWGAVPPWTPVAEKCRLSARGDHMAMRHERAR
ncbi:MAG: hypothetical protein ACRDS9_13160, partial [Pseudonocardiaceae bacterium]